MGLLKAGIGALSGVLADSWRDYFYCESMDADTLVVKGEKRTGGRSSNKKGTDNIISNGSIINVNDGQCMIIVESGKVVEICADPGNLYMIQAPNQVFSMVHLAKTSNRVFLKLVSVSPLAASLQKIREFTTSTQRKLWEISTVHLLLFLSELWIRLSDSHLILKSVATVNILTK